MDGRCLDDAADRAFGTEPVRPRPPRRRFRRRMPTRLLRVEADRPEPREDETRSPEPPQS